MHFDRWADLRRVGGYLSYSSTHLSLPQCCFLQETIHSFFPRKFCLLCLQESMICVSGPNRKPVYGQIYPSKVSSSLHMSINL